MDKVTQQNAANAEESASASEQMNAQAGQMKAIAGELQRIVAGRHGTKAPVSAGSRETRADGAVERFVRKASMAAKVRPEAVIPLGDGDFRNF